MEEFYKSLAEILEQEDVRADSVLADSGAWDSLSILSVVALADTQYRATLHANDVRNARTASDLWSLIQARRKA